MAGGKETPRQKMIGMMYLFLTAMLALNVSKEVLHSFVQVNDSLSATVANFTEKNNSIYTKFDQQYSMNKAKVEKWYNLANEVRKRANDLSKHLDELKIEIVEKADGVGAPAISDNKVIAELIGAKDNLDVGGEVMIVNKKGPELKQKIEDFRKFLLDNVDPKHTTIRNSLERNLNTNDPPAKDGMIPTWTEHTFGHMPLVAVVTMMSKVQSDVRNAEADILRYFYGQIGAQDFKFNKLEPVVIAKSNHILKGGTYEAQVFIAAQDTTQDPSVYIGNATKDDNGAYHMAGGYDSLTIENGKGMYEVAANSIGEKTWGGLIAMKAPDGTIKTYNFESSYVVAPPNAIISASANRVFYYGVPNPLEVSVPGLRADQLKPSATNANLIRYKGGWAIKPKKKGGKIVVSLSADIDGKRKFMGKSTFRVMQIPPPTPRLMPIGQKTGEMNAGTLAFVEGVGAILEGFIMENIKYEITEFTIQVQDGRFTTKETIRGKRFNNKALNMVKKLKRGQQLIVTGIKAKGPDGVKDLSPLIIDLK